MDYPQWFVRVTGHDEPHPWQMELGVAADCTDRLIRIPTGMGKTEGVLAAWAWHRLVRNDPSWPRRLVWCLPMRVLVEQTAAAARRLLQRMRDEFPGDVPEVSVHTLMGGVELEDWHLHPERPAVLVGTQDMLLSRALNRGYAAGRARWPLEYGLLNHDSLWVMDEVQLMDVGLATSVQLQAFRRERVEHALRPCRTWWMSATLQPEWLETMDARPWLPELRDGMLRIPATGRSGRLWDVRKPLTRLTLPMREDKDAKALARVVVEAHGRARPTVTGRVTLAIVNRVETAVALKKAVDALVSSGEGPDVRLVHSRFRGLERKRWAEEFLSRAACEDPATDRIVIATQVVEAGVDISATALVTELAPWPSLVQRFGRAARYGGEAEVVVVDRAVSGKDALPYDEAELVAAREALDLLDDVGLRSLEELEDRLERDRPELLHALYPYEPLHLLTRRECHELFDTTPDLSGADLDISRFIRSGEERDLFVCWVPGEPTADLQPTRDGLCPVPVYAAKKWLFARSALKEGCRAWVWDYLDGEWRRLRQTDCYPGQVVLVDAAWGGYDVDRGFTGEPPGKRSAPIPTEGGYRTGAADEYADQAAGREDLSRHAWKTIATHGREAAEAALDLVHELELPPDFARVLDLAARLHDWGKAHPVFQSSIRADASGTRPERSDLAKAPEGAWAPLRELYCLDERHGKRRGFRHELASVLAVFDLLHRVRPDHPALLGSVRALVEAGVLEPVAPEGDPVPSAPLVEEIAALDETSFNLLCYLVCSHHGKVRGGWQGTPHDQEFPLEKEDLVGVGQPLHGVREGDEIPPTPLAAADGTVVTMPAVTLHLDPAQLGVSGRYGPSWSERVHRLVDEFGPFTLAYLEALLRVADVRASRLETPDPLLAQQGVPA